MFGTSTSWKLDVANVACSTVCICLLIHYSDLCYWGEGTFLHVRGYSYFGHGGHYHTWTWWGEFCTDNPQCVTFLDPIGALLYAFNSIINTLFLGKKWFVSITFSSRDYWSYHWPIFSPKSARITPNTTTLCIDWMKYPPPQHYHPVYRLDEVSTTPTLPPCV